MKVRLMGAPAIELDGRPARAPRGRKAWALLAYLLLADRPPSRRHLADLLFGDADDPLGALRWTLAELRRCLGPGLELGGDPVTVTRGDSVVVDTDMTDLDHSGELLEGIQLPSNVEFESWLSVARHRISAALEARLRQAAVSLLVAGRAREAVGYAARAVACNPLEEGNHELLIRCLATAGDRAAAQRQLAICEDTLRQELGIEVSAAVREAVGVAPGSLRSRPLSGRAAAASQLEAGRAAILAGATDAGLQSLRRAVTEADGCKDVALQARALVALGSALTHAARGRDEEGAVALHEAIALAQQVGDPATAVTAYRELGFIEVQAGRRQTGDAWLTRAQALAQNDSELAGILGVRGMNASDSADYPAAFAFLDESAERAERCGDERQQAWSLSVAARAHLLRGERSQATVVIGRSLDLVTRQRWMAFLPWPQVLRAEIDLLLGELDTAADRLEQAWDLACQLGDPCWEGMAGRGIGMLHARRGDAPAAREWLDAAIWRSNRVTDRYQWVHGYVLDAAIGQALDQEDRPRAVTLVAALSRLAARCDMRELVVRAQLHEHHLGTGAGLGSVRLLAADIDNPALTRMVTEAG